MKKLLLILLCLPMIGFGQYQYKLDSMTLNFPLSFNTPEFTSYKFEYDSQGNNTTTILPNPSDSARYITDSVGTILYSLDYQVYFNSFNTNNQLMSVQHAFLESGSQNIDVIQNITFLYNSNGNLESTEYQRTTLGNSIFENSFSWTVGSGVGGKGQTTLTYDINNQNILIEYWDWDGSIYVPTSKEENIWQSGVLTTNIRYINPPTWEIFDVTDYNWTAGDMLSATSIQYQSDGSMDTNTYNCNYNNALMSNTAFPKYWDGLVDELTHHQVESQADMIFYHYSAFTSTEIQEHTTNKELLKVTDLLGRETKGTKNKVLFYIYDDGTVEKRIVIE